MDRKAGPWRLTGYALAQLALFVPTIVVFVLVVLGAALAIITVGIPILLVERPGPAVAGRPPPLDGGGDPGARRTVRTTADRRTCRSCAASRPGPATR